MMSEEMRFVGWFLANGLLWSGAWGLSRWVFVADGPCVALMHATVAAWCMLVVSAVSLGLLGVLGPITLPACGGAWGLLLLGILAITKRRSPSWWRHRLGAEPLGDAVGSQVESLSHLRARCVRWVGRDVWQRRWAIAWTLLVSLAASHIMWNGLLVVPTDWDSLAYHIPLVDHWLRDGTLYVPDCAFWYCPGNNELWALWAVAPFSGDYLVTLNNIPATLLLAVSTVELAGFLGLTHGMQHLPAMAILLAIPVRHQLISAENDVAVGALFVGALAYGVRYTRHGKWADLLWAAACGGLLAGVKYYALGYVVVAFGGVAALVVSARGWRPGFAVIVIGLLAVLLLGAYWYARNAWATGAPLFPKGLTEATDVWGHHRPNSHTSTLLWSGRWQVWPMLITAIRSMVGPYLLAATFFLPVTVVWLALSPRWQDKSVQRLRQENEAAALVALPVEDAAIQAVSYGSRPAELRVWLALMILLAGAIYLVTPNTVETVLETFNMLRLKYHPIRFSLCLLTLAGLGLACILHDLVAGVPGDKPTVAGWRGGALRHTGGAAISLLVITGTLYPLAAHLSEPAIVNVLLSAVVAAEAAVVWYLLQTSSSRVVRRLRWVVTVAAMLLLAWGCHSRAERWHAEFCRCYDEHLRASMFAVAGRWTPTQERICVCDDRYYPFLGSRRQFGVSRPLWITEYVGFLQYLHDHGATIAVATRVRDSSAQERYREVNDWITTEDKIFALLHQDRCYTAVRVDSKKLAEALAAIRKDEGPGP